MTESLTEKSMLARMASLLAHEIRNPLAIMNNSIYFVKTKMTALGGLDPKVEKHLGIIEQEIAHAQEILNEVSAYTREPETVPAILKLDSCAEEFITVCKLPENIKSSVKWGAGGISASIDRPQLQLALMHIVTNAVQSMPAGGKLSVCSSVSGNEAVIEISDTGGGAKPEDLSKLAEPFYTTKARALGLGLSIVVKIMERHGGKLKLTNSEKGLTVKLFFPVKK